MPNTTLVVVRPFAARTIGDLITVPNDITAILASEHAGYVVQMVMPIQPRDPKDA